MPLLAHTYIGGTVGTDREFLIPDQCVRGKQLSFLGADMAITLHGMLSFDGDGKVFVLYLSS